MVGWHHRLNGHEFEQILGDSEGQGSLACCSPWGHKETDMNERLNNDNKCKLEQYLWNFNQDTAKSSINQNSRCFQGCFFPVALLQTMLQCMYLWLLVLSCSWNACNNQALC